MDRSWSTIDDFRYDDELPINIRSKLLTALYNLWSLNLPWMSERRDEISSVILYFGHRLIQHCSCLHSLIAEISVVGDPLMIT